MVTPHTHDELMIATLASEVGLEIWKPVASYDNVFSETIEVSNLGRVRTLPYLLVDATGRRRKIPERSPKLRSKRGYHEVALIKSKSKKYALVHVLVLEAFVGIRPDVWTKIQTRHLDSNPSNNTLCNLAWGTIQEQVQDKKRTGVLRRGEEIPTAKLTEKAVKQIRRALKENILTQREIANIFNVHVSTIKDICNYRSWRHLAS